MTDRREYTQYRLPTLHTLSITLSLTVPTLFTFYHYYSHTHTSINLQTFNSFMTIQNTNWPIRIYNVHITISHGAIKPCPQACMQYTSTPTLKMFFHRLPSQGLPKAIHTSHCTCSLFFSTHLFFSSSSRH